MKVKPCDQTAPHCKVSATGVARSQTEISERYWPFTVGAGDQADSSLGRVVFKAGVNSARLADAAEQTRPNAVPRLCMPCWSYSHLICPDNPMNCRGGQSVSSRPKSANAHDRLEIIDYILPSIVNTEEFISWCKQLICSVTLCK